MPRAVVSDRRGVGAKSALPETASNSVSNSGTAVVSGDGRRDGEILSVVMVSSGRRDLFSFTLCFLWEFVRVCDIKSDQREDPKSRNGP